MKIGMIGLGKMGLNLSLNMLDHDIEVNGYDPYISDEKKETYNKITFKESIKDLINSLEKPRIIWVMVPSGDITESVLTNLSKLLSKDDIVIEGGNSNFNVTLKRAKRFKQQQIYYYDVGTSGGVYGARNGACFMIGGDKEMFPTIEPIFEAIATKDGYAYLGNSGAGHFVKMIHNGIEYGMMQAIGEGFAVLEASDFDLDFDKVSKVWANGSIIEGLLMRVTEAAFKKDPKLESIEGIIDDSGEGKWTIEEALNLEVGIPVISTALFTRYKSRDKSLFGEKIVAAMRNEFGGHKVYKK
ncbi:MAG: decarboxylating 6-phosphogluconate dehydrogenase [Candidatus Izimaplasma sp.]|nr:decarboxylating 6-phosphogluconate dehydrogenase [Candidatus Izimaplasma bacterium]